MMENISFTDPDEVPRPPGEVEIKNIAAEPYEDGKRVLIRLTFTPFQKDPSADIRVFKVNGEEEQVANVNIIETFDPDTEVTLHLRQQETDGNYRVEAEAFYLVQELSAEDDGPVQKPEKNIIGHAETTFTIPK